MTRVTPALEPSGIDHRFLWSVCRRSRLAPPLTARALLFLALLFCASACAQDWPTYGGDAGETHYSPLTQITRANVRNLQLAWEWKTEESPMPEFKTTPGVFEATPLMIDGMVYVSTPYNRVVALDPDNGREIWRFDPKAYEDGQVPNGTGFVHRGVAAWRDTRTGRLRIFMNSRYRLISLDASTGKPVGDFGDNGIVNLVASLRWETNPKYYTNTSPPVVYKDLVIVGNGVADRLVYQKDPPGDVRAFDVRTGKLAWTFHTVPLAGEVGTDTWGGGSEKFTGHTNVWAPMTLDAVRGLLYLPVSTPSNDFYGAARPGQNLFAESLVCLDAATGRRKWHFQLVHHGLWDYDPPGPPVLAAIKVGGKAIDAVVQLTKTGWAFVFDRVTGKPVWPIEERPVPASDAPGEKAWPTQPFPTKPPAFEEQGVTLDDAFDLTTELKAEAQAEMKKYRLGGIYSPPSLQGTFMRPGVIGGANWGGGAFDPVTGILYVTSSNTPAIARLKKVEVTIPGELDAAYVGEQVNATFRNGLPILKPPYGHLTAIDLNKGEIVWRVAFGDDARLRARAELKDVKLPERLGVAGAQGAIVTKGGVIFCGGGDTSLHAVDSATGQELWSFPLGRRSGATPMTYRTASGKQFVVIASGTGRDATLTAFALK
jgi:quinoprotein glucose dehydrogenase